MFKIEYSQIAAILAGLRMLQDKILGESPGDDYLNIATNGGIYPLPESEDGIDIDALCDALNSRGGLLLETVEEDPR